MIEMCLRVLQSVSISYTVPFYMTDQQVWVEIEVAGAEESAAPSPAPPSQLFLAKKHSSGETA